MRKKKKSFKLPSDRARRAKEHCSCLPRPTPPETRCRCCQHQSLSSCPSEPDEIRFDGFHPLSAHLSATYEHWWTKKNVWGWFCFSSVCRCIDCSWKCRLWWLSCAGEVVTFHCTLTLTGFSSDTSQSRYSAACIICAIIRSTSLKNKNKKQSFSCSGSCEEIIILHSTARHF